MRNIYVVGSLVLLCGVLSVTSDSNLVASCGHFPNCKSCPLVDGIASCVACWPPLYALSGDPSNPCIPCWSKKGCWLCKNLTLCERCEHIDRDGPDLNGEGTCSPCAPNCRKCINSGSGKCDVCNEGFFLDSASGTCAPCSSNCMQCPNSNDCSFCNRGLFGHGCLQRCTSNCDVCWDSATCKICSNGFYKNSALQCITLPPNCQTSDPMGICQTCVEGKVSPKGTCETENTKYALKK